MSSKVALIFNEPKCCAECPACYMDMDFNICVPTSNLISDEQLYVQNIPSFCLLKEVKIIKAEPELGDVIGPVTLEEINNMIKGMRHRK